MRCVGRIFDIGCFDPNFAFLTSEVLRELETFICYLLPSFCSQESSKQRKATSAVPIRCQASEFSCLTVQSESVV